MSLLNLSTNVMQLAGGVRKAIHDNLKVFGTQFMGTSVALGAEKKLIASETKARPTAYASINPPGATLRPDKDFQV